MIYFRVTTVKWDYQTGKVSAAPLYDDATAKSTGPLIANTLKNLSLFGAEEDAIAAIEDSVKITLEELNKGREKEKISDDFGNEVGYEYPFRVTEIDETFNSLIQLWDGDDYRNVIGFLICPFKTDNTLSVMEYRKFKIYGNDFLNKFTIGGGEKTVKSLKKAFHVIDEMLLPGREDKNNTFYDIFLCLCKKKGVAPSKAAIDIDLSKATATKWKNGSIPTGDTLQKLANYFKVPVDFILDGKVKKPLLINEDEAKILLDGLLLIAEQHRNKKEEYEKLIDEAKKYETDTELLTLWKQQQEDLMNLSYKTYDKIKNLVLIK